MGKAWRESYRLGCQRGIALAMRKARRKAREGAPSTALAVLDARLTQSRARLKTDNPDLNQKDVETVVDGDAFDAGKRQGRALAGVTPAFGAKGTLR